MKKNVIVGQSGGPTAVINASLYGIIKESFNHKEEIDCIYGMRNGIEGFMAGNYVSLSETLSLDDLELLKGTPAAYLGSCRFKLPEDLSSLFYSDLFKKFEEMNIEYFFYIGGNDSMDTVSKLSNYASKHKINVKIIGIPKTIDNDLVHTDHTPGFGSAAKYVASTVREIVLDSSVYQQKSVTIIELMGRHAGWLTAASVLARKFEQDNPLLIYLPESNFSLEQFSNDLIHAFEKNPNVIVCISEGISDEENIFICEYADEVHVDTFGHKMLTGSGKFLENYVKKQFGVKVRSIELNVNQRCSSMIASLSDMQEATMVGSIGVKAALDGQTGIMIAFKRESSNPYSLSYTFVDVNHVCNKEKPFPSQWITNNGTDISPEFLEYVLPLIQGEPIRMMEQGLPKFLHLS